MATQRSLKRLSALKKSRRFRDRARQESRRLNLERLEDRHLLAVFVLPNNGVLLNDGDTRTIAPKDLTFRFTDLPGIDPLTINDGIKLVRAGQDGVFGQANDVVVAPGFIGLGDNNREVIMRFAETLPDDTYQITVIGTGTTPLRDTSGQAFNGGQDFVLNFRLDLGAQVVAVVPQPVRKLANGLLSMTEQFTIPGNPTPQTRTTQNMIVVYFNNDNLNLASAARPEFYHLYATKNTLDPADDSEVLPTSVEYDPATDVAKLIFGTVTSLEQIFNDGSRDPAKSFRLRIGTNEVSRAITQTTRLGADPASTFAGALDVGGGITAGAQGGSVTFAQGIDSQFFALRYPGDGTEPGHRDIPAESHLNGGNDGTSGITTFFYNFHAVIGVIPDGIGGTQPSFNLITENQKQRVREIFELYTRYSGVQFIESADSGLTVATGDLRTLDPTIPVNAVAGLAGGGLAIMNNLIVWDDAYGANWFQTAMHEIGHLLGQGHTYDLPPLTIQGSDGSLQFTSPGAEPVFPGDNDIVHMRVMYRPESKDIDMYRVVLDGTGVLTVETFAERLPNASSLDTNLRLYKVNADGTPEEIARNDDYFSKDSLIKLTLGPGTYYVGVTASGNDQYDPTIFDSGIGGTTQGVYELKLDFRKNASDTLIDAVTPANPNPAPLIPDTLAVAFDGDADGTPGGVYNFWFRAAAPRGTEAAGKARTLFVDKTALNGGIGSLGAPYNNIATALANAQPFDIVRIVGNGGADGNLATLFDNRAYQLGFNDFGQTLSDGPELAVPKDVTVMIDAGAIFQMRRSQLGVGSTSPDLSSDRSGGALQVLGTPTTSVYFTSYNEVADPPTNSNIGLDQNPLNTPPAPGDWGGLAFHADLDRADGRFDHEAVGVFLNYVNHADIRYGGGQVNVNSVFQVITPVFMADSRPTITFNTIRLSADAAMSANPDSFEETNFQAPRYWPSFADPLGSAGVITKVNAFGLSFGINDQNGAIYNVAFQNNEFYRAGTAVSDFGLQLGTDTTTFQINTTGGLAQITTTVTDGGSSVLVTGIYSAGGVTIQIERRYEFVTGLNVLRTTTTLRNIGATAANNLRLFDTFDPDQGNTANTLGDLSYNTINDLLTLGGLYSVAQATNGRSVVLGDAGTEGFLSSLSIASGLDVNNFFSAPFDPNGLVQDVGLALGFEISLGVGESRTLTFDQAFGDNAVSAQNVFVNAQSVSGTGGAVLTASGSFTLDYSRVGPDIHGNRLVTNTTNGLFVRTRTPAGDVLEELTVAGRLDDTDIVHVLEENLSIRGTPGGPTHEEEPPPVELIIPTVLPGVGNFPIGTSVDYRLTYVDLLGNEGLASATFSVTGGITAANSAVFLQQLPNPAVPNPEFVARRLYRRTSASAPFTFVAQIPASATDFIDRNDPTSGIQQVQKVLSDPATIERPRLDASLVIDPTIVIKTDGARIDVGVGANLLAEGHAGQEVIFTSLSDDRYGAGGTFDNNNDNQALPANVPVINTTTQGSATQNEVQTVTLSGPSSGGNFTLTFNGQTTLPIPFNASAAVLQTALEGLTNIKPGDVAVSFNAGIWTVTFTGTLGNTNVLPMTGASVAAGDAPDPGDWAGIFFSPDSKGSIDNAVFAYGGGLNRIEGTFAGFNVIEIHEADVRVAHSKFQFNDDGQGGQAPASRFGRGFNRPATIFVRGAQPIILSNTALENGGPFININANALNSETVVDTGRQTNLIERTIGHLDNNGPLIVDNKLRDNGINGMIVRGATLTTESVWDDTDIVHVLLDAINVPDFHTYGGLRLESSATASLVVKSSGPAAGFTATGRPIEIDDRIGGILQILGQPGFPVVLTSFTDDTAGAGFTPEGVPQVDTNGDGLGGGSLAIGPEVNNGTLIDNDVDPNTVGHFEVRPGPGGGISVLIPNTQSGATAQGQTQLFINQDFIFDFLNYVDVGGSGAAIDLSTTTITTQPTLISDDLVATAGTFAGANGTVNWRVETRIDDGQGVVFNTLILSSSTPFGALHFINYLDEDVLAPSDDLLYRVGSPGQANFRLLTLDNQERIGFSQGGTYIAGPDLVNATWDGWAADRYNDLQAAITGAGTNYIPTGNVDTVDLPPLVDPSLGPVNGLADVTTAMSWTVSPTATSARITTFLELIPTAPVSSGTPGEWQGITIDQYAHDRNVETILEQEAAVGDGLANANPLKAQFIGGLGPFEKGGDENLRLGLTVHGLVNQPSDVDVYSFSAKSNTEVWIDIDRTTDALDSVVELIDINGNVLARSNNSLAETQGAALVGLARLMWKTPPFEGQDFYSTNPRDAGFRVVLPGPSNTTNTYFVRVRSAPTSFSGEAGSIFNPGLTSGVYQLQLRLREVDELGGATVRFAKIANAVNGIRVLGQPTHSPLAGEHAETNDGANNLPAGAQFIGNLLNSDRSSRSIAGSLSSGADIDWYSLDINYDATQGLAGVSTLEDWWSTIFDIDYADGFARANLVISVFDLNGNLILSSRDSNVADDRPNPTSVADVSDLLRGTSGAADPWIGPAEMHQGTYLVAVSADARMPQVLDQFSAAVATNPLVRLEPMDSVLRLVEDHIGSTGGSNIDTVEVNFVDQNSIVPWSLQDVTLFVNQDAGVNTERLLTVDPFSGTVETTVGNYGRNVGDIAMHPRGRLYTYSMFEETGGPNRFRDAQAGNFFQIDTGTGAITSVGDDTIATYMQDPTATAIAPVLANDIGNNTRVGEGVHFRAINIGYFPGNTLTGDYLGLAVGGRDPLPGNGNDFPNILYQFNPDTGIAASAPAPDRSGNGLLSGAATQIVERGILDTLIDSIPTGNADAIQVVEATVVNGGTTTFQIMDDYPPGNRPPEIPSVNPDPTTFRVRTGPPGPGNPGTLFEFDAGPEALFNINPTVVNDQIIDTRGFFADGTKIEFDTGPVVFVTGIGNVVNYPVGSTLQVTDVDPDPLGPGTRPPQTITFEFTATGVPTIPNAIPISIAGNPSAVTMADRIVAAINAQQATQGFTTQAVRLSGTPRVSLTNLSTIPTINPNDDSNALLVGVAGAVIQGALGVTAGNVSVRIEETSVQADLAPAFARANLAGTMPLNTQVGVSGGIGVGRVTIGLDGDRLNLSGATTIANSGLSAVVFSPVFSQGGVTFSVPARVPVPFLAQDDAAALAQRMATALAGAGFATAFATATAVIIPGATVVSADPPLSTAAQAPGGTITGMASIDGVVWAVSDTGGLFRIINPQGLNAQLDYIGTATDLLGIQFGSLAAGPRNVENSRYRNTLFGIDTDGELFAFDTQGVLQHIFSSAFNPVSGQIEAQTSVQTGLTDVNGLAFSNLDYNLFHNTPNRNGDSGHGINVVQDSSRAAVPGGTSIYFGFENVGRNNVPSDQHYAPAAGANNYDLPGGAQGTVETNTFSLKGYSSADNPVLYFNYYLATEAAGHNPNTPIFMRDSFRVFVAGDDGVWQFLGTNNGNRFAPNPALPPNDEIDYAPLRVQETFDNTNTWRQARIPLADFAGQDNLRLRFDFSTAGSMNIGDYTQLNGDPNTPTNGDELRTVDGIFLRDGQRFTLTAPGTTNQVFEFDLGYTLVAPEGVRIPDGARFTIDGTGFEFNSAGGVGAGFTPVPYLTTDSPEQVAQNIFNAIGAVSPKQLDRNRINLRGGAAGAVTGALAVSSVGMPAGFVEGAPGVTAGTRRIDVHAGMDRTEVREAIALVMATVYAQGVRAQIKTHDEMIRLIGYRWVGQVVGPNSDPLNQRLLGITTALPGDEFGAFNASKNPDNSTDNDHPGALRGQNNGLEGVYIDDIIIGFAERGEMATAAGANQNFAANPLADPNNIPNGPYQLEVRRAAEAGIPSGSLTALPTLTLLPQIDPNDRLEPSRMLTMPEGAAIADGQNFALSDGVTTVTFEFNDTTVPGSGVTQGRIRIDYVPTDTNFTMAQRVVRAVNSAPVQSVLKVQAQLSDGIAVPAAGALPSGLSTTVQVNLIGNVSIPTVNGLPSGTPLDGGLNFVVFSEQFGDRNQFRDQGQIILQGNEIRDSSQWGILIDAAARNAADGSAPHEGPVRNLPQLNTQSLVPGVVAINNVIYGNTLGGIRVSGDTAPDAPVAFERIINNSLFGNGGTLTGGSSNDVGIQVDQNSSPTLLNNIVANFNQGVNVSANSSTTVLGGMVFQGNRTNSNVGLGNGVPFTLTNQDPLFVNAAGGNFYLKAQSRAIDSSVDSLLDRPPLVTVRNPLGILQSPILSPDFDGVGQRRVDDPSVSTQSGVGLNPFKDRGAIDRVDFVGPTGLLINPPDNDADGTDLDPSPNVVVRTNDIIRDFQIRLIDRFDPNGAPEGSDIDDLSVDSSKVKVEVVGGPFAGVLVEGIDYAFSYDTTNNLIVLTPLGGLWPLSRTYRITIDNSAANGITDRAGNVLLPNQADGTHIYTIFLGSAVDYGDAPDSYHTLAASNGPSHQIVPGIRLGAIVGAEADGQPSPDANLDSGDDGLVTYALSRGALSSMTIVASAVGKIDVWLDLNRNGVFDANEYIIQGFNFITPGVQQLIPFTLSDGPQGDTIARIRFSTAGISTPTGFANDGEVEDYKVTMIGPAFHNGTLAPDVTNDFVVNTLDLLIEINFLTFLTGQLLPGQTVATLPPTSPPYVNPPPVFDPTGGGVIGQGRFVDVAPTGGTFGQIDLFDLLALVNYLTLNFMPGGGGEGEAAPSAAAAAGSAAPSAAADAGSAGSSGSSTGASDSLLAPVTLFAAPNIVLEVRDREPSVALDDESLLPTSHDEATLAVLAAGSTTDYRTVGRVLSLEEHARRKAPLGPLEADSWDDLLGELAADVGGLPNDKD